MIQANELRIGNFISERDNHRIYPINEISEYGVKVKYWSCGENEIISYNKLMPVILTPQLLDKCGLSSGYVIPCDYNSFKIEIVHDIIWLSTDDNRQCKNINFLHQLQNLYFALTGEELKISL